MYFLKGIIIYESKYGNTKAVAERIIEGIKSVSRIDFDLRTQKEIKPISVAGYDIIALGSPNHMGKATRGMRKFIEKIGKLELQGKKGFLFDTYTGGDHMKAVRSMEKIITERVKGLELISSGLSVQVKGMRGPPVEGALDECLDYGKRIGSLLK
ncbi:MAG: flavodoxin family protein [Candidatus Hodarchaeota archaeon]